MPTLTIYDTILVPRPVAVPDACPKCGVSFVTSNNLVEWDRAEVQFHGKLSADEYLVDHEDDRGDSFSPVAYVCLACNHTLDEGLVHEVLDQQRTTPLDTLLEQLRVAPSATITP